VFLTKNDVRKESNNFAEEAVSKALEFCWTASQDKKTETSQFLVETTWKGSYIM